jgi:hypothetical protein
METRLPGSERHHNRRGPLILCVLAAAFAVPVFTNSTPPAPPNDFAFYWTAARLVLEGRNPYSVADTVDLQRRVFPGHDRALVMLNPPWILPLIVPFGIAAFATGKSIWFAMQLASLAISVHWLWDLYGENGSRWIGWLVAATFLPVAVVLAIGQIGPLILLGLAGYLRFQARKPYLAGAFLFFAALKPHLVFLLWIALLLYTLHHKRWESLAAFFLMLGVASVMAVMLDHSAFY